MAASLVPLLSFGQDISVSGKVTDEGKEPLPGVNVIIQGTDNGTVTDIDGNFKIDAPSDATLLFSFIGYETQTIAVGNQTTINISMVSDIQSLSEVVVTAFGIKQNKKALGYAVQQVSGDEIQETNQPNIVNALQGKVAGVTINNGGGAAGAGASIIIRGVTSLDPSRNNQPLFIIDGLPMSNETQAASVRPSAGSNQASVGGDNAQFSFSNRGMDINPDDIESISILKGAAATALYGLRAANGAVVITTKKGQAGKARITYSFAGGWDVVGQSPEIQTKWGQGRNGERRIPGSGRLVFWQLGPPVVDGLDQIYNPFVDLFETGTRVSHSVSVSGGNENATYYTSVSRFDQDGIAPETNWDRTTVKLAGSAKVGDKFAVSGVFNYTNSGGRRPNGGDKSIMSSLSFWSPSFDINNYIEPDGTQINHSRGIIDNPRYFLHVSGLEDDVNRVFGNISLDYNPLDWLSVKYQFGGDIYSDVRNRFVPKELDVGSQVQGFIVNENVNFKELNSNFFITATKSFNEDFNGSLLVGQSVVNTQTDVINVRGEGLNLSGFNDISNTTNKFATASNSLRRLIGVFFDAKLDYKGTVFLNVTGRNDWSSTLPKENRSFFYPAVNLGYVFTETLGLANSKFLHYGKIRASWSKVGKDAPPHVLGTNYGADGAFPFNGVGGFSKNSQGGSLDLKPETTTSLEFGADLRFFNDRLGVDVTYFKQNSKDQILRVPVSNTSGFSRFFINAGEMQNSGIELLITGTVIKAKNFTWEAVLNWSKISGEILSMPSQLETIEFGNSGFSNVSLKIEEGGAPGDIFAHRFRYEDGQLYIGSDGLPRVVLDSTVRVGNAFPDWQGGLTNTFSYKGLSLSFLIEVRQGGEVHDLNFRNSLRNGILKETELRNEEAMFTGVKDNPNGDGFVQNDIIFEIGEDLYRSSTRYNRAAEILVEDASWVRLRNVSLAYTLPKSLISKTPFSSVRFSFTGNNIFLSTPFRGYDPESNAFGSGTNNFGFVGRAVPATKSYTIGLNVTL
ncbi:MAG: SusC/RagA family TonB-linked outer membrane protein [Cyclobacteriaceae bacterium]|nr:SusC/RagA family TonB-linked outer membrane protein [Cyclobacteriaceae bacterium]